MVVHSLQSNTVSLNTVSSNLQIAEIDTLLPIYVLLCLYYQPKEECGKLDFILSESMEVKAGREYKWTNLHVKGGRNVIERQSENMSP